MARRALILAMSTAARRGDICHLRRQNEFLKDQGAPFSVAGIENKFGDWCDAAGPKGRSLHGVRKGVSSLLASERAPNTESDVLLGHEMGRSTSARRSRNRSFTGPTGSLGERSIDPQRG